MENFASYGELDGLQYAQSIARKLQQPIDWLIISTDNDGIETQASIECHVEKNAQCITSYKLKLRQIVGDNPTPEVRVVEYSTIESATLLTGARTGLFLKDTGTNLLTLSPDNNKFESTMQTLKEIDEAILSPLIAASDNN